MTLEIVQYRCPTCDHLMAEEEYRHACNAFDKKVQEKCKESRLAFFHMGRCCLTFDCSTK